MSSHEPLDNAQPGRLPLLANERHTHTIISEEDPATGWRIEVEPTLTLAHLRVIVKAAGIMLDDERGSSAAGSSPPSMELEKMTTDQLTDWATWQLLESITKGKPIRSTVWLVMDVAKRWAADKQRKGNT